MSPRGGAAGTRAGSGPAALLRGWRREARRVRDFLYEQHVRPRLLGLRVEHVSGPTEVPYGDDEVVAICVARNSAVHLPSFVEHHLRLGVRHVFLLDNGSEDDSVEVARGLEGVTVLRTDAPYQRYENTMKRYLARRFSPRGWNLCVDVDERFDYPGSDAIPLRDLLRRLNQRGHTAVVAHMLDRFPDCSLAELERIDRTPDPELYAFYDVSNIRRTDYLWGELSNPEIRMYWDGIRNTLFGSRQGLTKAPLVRVEPRMELFADWHHARPARVADFTAVLLHFPFAGHFHDKVRDAVQTGRYGGISVTEYGRYWEGLRDRGDTRFLQPTSRRWSGVDALADDGFLTLSSDFRAWIQERRAAARERGGDG